jgi:Macrocin-O-methyltransferase (TylF)
MANYLITIIQPKNYLHSEAFREVAETLQYGLRSSGHTAVILSNTVDPAVTNIILGAHLLGPQDARAIPSGSIVYNLEQLGSSHLGSHYYDLAQKHQIWDYSPVNIAKWNALPCAFPALLVEVGFVPELRRIESQVEQDIDVLFYGSLNEHRLNVLKRLEEAGAKVHSVFGVYGEERDRLIARAKIVLNIHYYEAQLFEIVRVSYLLTNAKAVVTEASPDLGDLKEAVAVFPPEGMVEGCLDLLRDDKKRRELESRGFAQFSQRSAAQIISRVLRRQPDKLKRDIVSPERELRTLYLDMVQKCVINLIYEDPNQDYWSPHRFNRQLRELGRDWPAKAHSMIGNRRISNLRQIVEFVIENKIPGDLIETGVWRGGACILMRAIIKAYGIQDRRVWVADSFCGLPAPRPEFAADSGDNHHLFPALAVPLEEVQANFGKYGLLDDQVCFLKGWFSETLPDAPIQQLAVLRMDGDMYASTMDALGHLYDKVVDGGFIIVDDFGAVPGCRQAVLEFRASRQIAEPIQAIDGYGVFWRKAAILRSVVAESPAILPVTAGGGPEETAVDQHCILHRS